MVVCKFFQNGHCKNGDRCRFEHPGANNMPSNNRFAALQNSGNSRDGKSSSSTVAGFAGVDRDNLIKDLSTERPQWILSCYGPGRNAPEQLFGGPLREQSFEEMRLKGYTSSNPQQAVQEFQTLVSESERQMQVALNDLDGAIKFLVDAQNKHPNRNDIVDAINSTGKVADPVNPILNTTAPPSAGAFGSTPNSNAFGSTPAPSNAFGGGGAFGKPAFGAPTAPASTPAFGKPAFGAPSAPASTGAFGQPSMLGAKPNPFASGASSGFGQPSALGGGGGGGFGQPSALGQKPNPFAAATTSAPFGQTPTTTAAAPSGFSAFANGGSNGFSSGTPATNPFVQTPTPGFGQPPTGPSAMNGNAFAKPSNAFGQPSPLGAPAGPASSANPFAKPSNAFGQPAQAPTAPMSQTPAFGQPSGGFGQPSSGGLGQPSSGGFGQPSSGFGQPSQLQNPLPNGNNAFSAASNPFSSNNNNNQAPVQQQSQSQNQQQPQNQPRPTTSTPGNPYPPTATHTHPPLSSYATRNASNQLTMFKGHQVHYNSSTQHYEYRNRDGSVGKVLFPDGPPPFYGCTEEREEVYTGDGGDGLRRVYERLRDGGSGGSGGGFEGGVVPLVAPRREWCLWDF